MVGCSLNMLEEYNYPFSPEKTSIQESIQPQYDYLLESNHPDISASTPSSYKLESPSQQEPTLTPPTLTPNQIPVMSSRLPVPCPLPMSFSPCVTKAIADNKILGNNKLALIRECSLFYYGLCPYPTPKEYETMAKLLCDKYPDLKNKIPVNGSYWVSNKFKCTIIITT